MPGPEEALERAKAFRARSLPELQGQFTDSWFPGGEAFQEPVIRLHDAAHQWSNISPSPRGELQQNILDIAGTQRLYEDTGARGFVNSYPLGVAGVKAEDFTEDVAGEQIEQLIRGSERSEDPIRGVAGQESLPVNSPARLQVPPISLEEARELVRRGQEFYGGVGEEFSRKARPSIVRNADPNRVVAGQPFSPAPGLETELATNAQAQWIHENGGDIRLSGGYDAPGRMPFGPMEARLNRPLQYTVDEGMLMREAATEFRKGLEAGRSKLQSRFPGMSPSELQEQEKWLRREISHRYGLPDFVGSSAEVDPKAWFADHDRSIRDAATYGMGKEASALQYVMRDRSDDAALGVAARARDATKLSNAIRFGFNTTTDIAGSVPLFDPDFRAAVERNDLAGAAKRALTDYAAGAAAAPVGGAVTGAVQRAAPAVAARVLPAVAGAVRVGNPVAVVSQLGGDARQSAAARIADSQAAVRQQNLAEQARQRGSRWSIPTPWGRVGVPELGISESGGLFLGGRQQTRPLGSRATLGGRPVVWAGPEYGWQSEASARKLGVRAR